MRKIAQTRGLVAMLVLAAAACDDSTSPVRDAATLEIRPGFVRTVAGASVEFEARFFDGSGNPARDETVEWSSLDEELLQLGVSSATAIAPGWARVVATAGSDEALTDTALVAIGIAFSGVTSGDDYTCGWTDEGNGWCWGSAHAGSFYPGLLGGGTGAGSPTPIAVTGGLDFTQIDAGRTHTCGIADGAVYCWGYNRGAALGFNGCGMNACDEPIDMELAGEFTDVSVPSWFDRTTCATGPAGLYCWGSSGFGALGVDPIPCSPYCSPRLVSASLTRDVAMGRQHGCALDAQGQALCWGDDLFGQLGLAAGVAPATCGFGGTPCALTPQPVAPDQRFERLEAGTYFTCGLTGDGRVFCWGNYDAFDQNVITEPGRTPADVSGDLRFTALGAGWFHACGVATTGELYCWGQATWEHAMGTPVTGEHALVAEPQLVEAAGARFTAVDAGPQHTCAVASDGAVRCMGSGWGIGQGTFGLSRPVPTAIVPPGPLPDEIELLP